MSETLEPARTHARTHRCPHAPFAPCIVHGPRMALRVIVDQCSVISQMIDTARSDRPGRGQPREFCPLDPKGTRAGSFVRKPRGGDSVGLPTLSTAVPKRRGEFLRLDRAALWACGACETVRHRPGPDRPAGHTHGDWHGGFPEAAQSLVGYVSSALSRLKREGGDKRIVLVKGS